MEIKPRKLKGSLRLDGSVLACAPNASNSSQTAELLASVPPYHPEFPHVLVLMRRGQHEGARSELLFVLAAASAADRDRWIARISAADGAEP
jgi:hypothetical protein